MQYPIPPGAPTRLNQSSGGPISILNNGPGNLYLYRNSACSVLGAYDAIIGSGGAYTTPGGELWGVSDGTGLTCVVLTGAGVVNTGSTSISGVVTTVSTGGSTGGSGGSGGSTGTPFIRGYTFAPYGSSNISLAPHSSTQQNDLLVAVAGNVNYSVGFPNGWTLDFGFGGRWGGGAHKVATASDVNGNTAYAFQVNYQDLVGIIMLTIANASVVDTVSQPGVTYSNQQYVISSKNTQIVLLAEAFGGTTVGSWSWTSQTSPVAPQPSIGLIKSQTNGNPTGMSISSFNPSWNATTSYSVSYSPSPNGGNPVIFVIH